MGPLSKIMILAPLLATVYAAVQPYWVSASVLPNGDVVAKLNVNGLYTPKQVPNGSFRAVLKAVPGVDYPKPVPVPTNPKRPGIGSYSGWIRVINPAKVDPLYICTGQPVTLRIPAENWMPRGLKNGTYRVRVKFLGDGLERTNSKDYLKQPIGQVWSPWWTLTKTNQGFTLSEIHSSR